MTISKYLPKSLVNFYHFCLACIGSRLYGNPSRELKVIGVTGTNGKTTVVEMLSFALKEAGFRVASASSIQFRLGDNFRPNKTRMTMPGRFFVQKFLREAEEQNCQYAVLEITSQGIEQSRHSFVDFDAVIFTNLSPEHIEAHGGFENYKNAKGKLFKETPEALHIINTDDKEAKYFLDFAARQKIGYCVDDKNEKPALDKIIKADDFKVGTMGVEFKIKEQQFDVNLVGEYNGYNALAVIAYLLEQGIDLPRLSNILFKFKKIDGRGEEVMDSPFRVIVDYAFTPIALELLYKTLKPQAKKLIAVLGSAGGGRDKWKRPALGEIADRYAEEIIITNEDPFEEDPLQIIEDVAKGVKAREAKKIYDRREAIKMALSLAQPGDVVVITGKGCEPTIEEKGKKIPWDDREVVKQEYKRLRNDL